MLAIPVLLIITLLIAIIKKVKVYDSFVAGTREAVDLMISLLPYLVTIFVAIELMSVSGLSKTISGFMAPFLGVLGIPKELSEIIIMRPLTGSGSIALLENIYKTYGVDSYISRCASVIVGSSDTVLYVAVVYFSKSKDKKTSLAIPISLFATFVGAILACFLCRFL